MKTSEIDRAIAQAKSAGWLTVRPYNSGGSGGQHSNRTLNAVELTASVRARDTNERRLIRVKASTAKSQLTNRRRAYVVLMSKIGALMKPNPRARGPVSSWGSPKIRTYHRPDNRVVDHASSLKMTWDETVGKGDLGPMIEARRRAIA